MNKYHFKIHNNYIKVKQNKKDIRLKILIKRIIKKIL